MQPFVSLEISSALQERLAFRTAKGSPSQDGRESWPFLLRQGDPDCCRQGSHLPGHWCRVQHPRAQAVGQETRPHTVWCDRQIRRGKQDVRALH